MAATDVEQQQLLIAGEWTAASRGAPVVRGTVLETQGPQFARTLNAVSRLLTTAAMRQMNAAVVFRKRSPAVVAHEFLQRHGLD